MAITVVRGRVDNKTTVAEGRWNEEPLPECSFGIAMQRRRAMARADRSADLRALLAPAQQQVRRWVSDMDARESSWCGRRGRS